MTAPEPRPVGADGNARGLVVLAVAVAVGVLLLANLGGGGDSSAAGTKEETSSVSTSEPLGGSTTAATTTTAATGSSRTPSEVKVLVLNGGGPTGSAKSNSDDIGASGYTMGTPGNSPVNVEATTFFYAEDYQAEAIAVASVLGKTTDAVKPLADAGLGGAEGDANVVVVLGPDAPPVSDSSGTTTTTTG